MHDGSPLVTRQTDSLARPFLWPNTAIVQPSCEPKVASQRKGRRAAGASLGEQRQWVTVVFGDAGQSARCNEDSEESEGEREESEDTVRPQIGGYTSCSELVFGTKRTGG